MLIDWFTIVAQIINFLILVWLLKRFLYKPILNAMAERERKIAASQKTAEEQTALAEKEQEVFKQKNEAFEQQRVALLKQAQADVEEKRRQMYNDARAEVDQLQLSWQTALENEKDAFRRELARRVQQEVFSVAKQTLEDLAGVKLEERMADIFIQRLKTLDKTGKKRIQQFMEKSPAPVIVRSTFALSPTLRQEIAAAVEHELKHEIKLEFETVPELISGLELAVAGQKVSWTIANYLAALEKRLEQVVTKD